MLLRCTFIIFISLLMLTTAASARSGMLIASQEDSSLLRSNTLPSLIYAMATGADLVEIQLVMTQDNQLVVFNDLFLDEKTNVATIFPERSREDGRYYVIDFSLEEIRQLSLRDSGLEAAPGYHIPSFFDVLLLHGHVEKELERKRGLYLEIKSPWFHTKEGKDIGNTTLTLLKQAGFTGKEGRNIYLQCYDPEELQRIHDQVAPNLGLELQFVQLLGSDNGQETKRQEGDNWVSYDYGWLYTKLGLKVIATFADILGIRSDVLLNQSAPPIPKDYIQAAKGLGLQIHARDVGHPPSAEPADMTFEKVLNRLFSQFETEAITTGHWIEAATYLKAPPQKTTEPAMNNTTKAEAPPLNPVELTPEQSEQVRDTATQSEKE